VTEEERQAKRREAQRIRSRRWYLANKERHRQLGEAWRKANPEAFNKIQRRSWHKAHPEKQWRVKLTAEERQKRRRDSSLAWYHRNKAETAKAWRERYHNDPIFRAKLAARAKQVPRNQEKDKARHRRNYAKHRDRKIAYARTWREANRERHLEAVERWQLDHPELVRQYALRSRAKVSAAIAFLRSLGFLDRGSRATAGITRSAALAYAREQGLL
jgi:hypothetical protein